MTTEETNTTTLEPSTNGAVDTTKIIIIIGAGGGGGALILIIVVVVLVVVCLRRRRRKEGEGAPPMPPLDDDPPFEPESPIKYQRRNSDSDINNVRPVERRNDFQLLPTSTQNSRSQQMNPEYYDTSDDDDDDDDKDYVNSPTSPDYENNPISIAKAEAEAELRLQQRRNGPNPSLAQSHVLNPTPRQPIPLRHAHTLQPEVNVGSDVTSGAAKNHLSAQKVNCPNRDHTPWKKQAYINTSRSLEELDKRTVPLPPSMPSNSSLAKKKLQGPAPPPKSHSSKAKGYVNQPTPY